MEMNINLYSVWSDEIPLIEAEFKLKRYVRPDFSRDGFGCIYFLFDKNKVVYVGQTKGNVLERIGHHVKDKQFDSYSTLHVPAGTLNAIERAYIKKYQPAYNRVHTDKMYLQ